MLLQEISGEIDEYGIKVVGLVPARTRDVDFLVDGERLRGVRSFDIKKAGGTIEVRRPKDEQEADWPLPQGHHELTIQIKNGWDGSVLSETRLLAADFTSAWQPGTRDAVITIRGPL